jgi:hypothetical protein
MGGVADPGTQAAQWLLVLCYLLHLHLHPVDKLCACCCCRRFVVVMHGPDERRTPGNTLVVQPDKPFTGLAQVLPP